MDLRRHIILFLGIGLLLLQACKKDDNDPNECNTDTFQPTPYVLNLPSQFSLLPPPVIPEDNPMTVEGVELGRQLFFEKQLSINNSISCGSCHKPAEAFNDKDVALSLGAQGQQGIRNAMPLFNLDWARRYNWHGNVNTLEEQAFGPVRDQLELMETWPNVVSKLQADSDYPALFEKAFGTDVIDSNKIVMAIAQFERTLISGESKVDNHVREIFGLPVTGAGLNDQERRGLELFMEENKGDCFHCHGDVTNPLWTDNDMRNNGLDAMPDSGFAAVTKNPADVGKFKTPSIRNLIYTAPYMHDGRFATLRDVIDFYTGPVQYSPTIDASMKVGSNGVNPRSLTEAEKDDLIAFLLALTDTTFVQNPDFQDPN